MPFRGPHQAGITRTPAPATGLMAVVLRCSRGDRADLRDLLRDLSEEIERPDGRAALPEERDPAFPPLYTGVARHRTRPRPT